ncbi:MAG: baseplate J/gp47 family protein [Eubacterium sp.]|nr:baseplate J/gp47 family protein [Eubacterium sp.]
MKITYDSIINKLKEAYFEKTGERVFEESDLSARFQAVASELFSLAAYGEFILSQAFPQSAKSEYLDLHAALRGMTRKQPSKARGTLTFMLNEAALSDVEIPQGTVCASEKSAYIQFETTESAVIQAGETAVDVPARALECGAQYNVSSGEVSVMVTPPVGVSSVINDKPFEFGYDSESDEALRERLVNSYSIPKSGMSFDSIRQQLLQLDGVLDAGVFMGENNSINVYVKSAQNVISQELENEIRDNIPFADMLGYTVNVFECETVSFDLALDITAESSKLESVARSAEKALEYLKNASQIGRRIELSRIAYSLSDIDGVKYCDIASPSADGGIINCTKSQALKLADLTVNCHE